MLLKNTIPEQSVRLHNGEDWSRKAKIFENHKSDRSYLLEKDKGTIIRRNRRHMMRMKEKFECSPPEDLVFDIPEIENNVIEMKQQRTILLKMTQIRNKLL